MKAQRLGKLCLFMCYFAKPIFPPPPECNIELCFDRKRINAAFLTFKSNVGSFQRHNVTVFVSWVRVSKTLQPLPQIQTENYERKAGQRQGNISSCKQPHVRSFPRNPFSSPKVDQIITQSCSFLTRRLFAQGIVETGLCKPAPLCHLSDSVALVI